MSEPGTQRGTPGDRPFQSTPEEVPQLGVHQLVEQPVQDLGLEGDLARLNLLRVLDGGIGRKREDLSLALGIGLADSPVVDLLEYARNREHPGRTHHLEFLEEVGDPVRVVDLAALVDASDLHQPGEDVGEGQEHQGRRLGVDNLVGDALDLAGRPHEVAHRQHASLGPSGGAGGVDEGRKVVLGDRSGAVHHLLVRIGGSGLDQ